MGVYVRPDSVYYWMALEREGKAPLRRSTRVLVDAPSAGGRRDQRDLAEQVYITAMADLVWDLVWAGALTNDTLAPLRTRLGGGGTHSSKPAAPSEMMVVAMAKPWHAFAAWQCNSALRGEAATGWRRDLGWQSRPREGRASESMRSGEVLTGSAGTRDRGEVRGNSLAGGGA